MSQMTVLREPDVDALATVQLTAAAARDAASVLAAGTVTTGRVQVADDTTWMRVLAGMIPSLNLVGYKEFHRVGKRVHYHVSLFARSSGDAIGIVDGRRITSLRTAAMAGVAVAHHVGEEPVHLAVIGSGEEAREGLRALAALTSVTAVRVYSPNPVHRQQFAAAMAAELVIPVEAVSTLETALDAADVAYVATSATQPFLDARQAGRVRVLAAIGSTRPDQRELHGDVPASFDRVVVDGPDATAEAGDLLAAREQGWRPDIAVLLGHDLDRPPAAGERVLFKSVGSVEQDLVLAHRLLRAAAVAGVGETLNPVGSLRVMR